MTDTAFPDHFSMVAAAYAQWRPHYPEALFAWLATLPRTRALAWDCGAGTGQATVPLTRYFQRVVATDASAAQLDAAPRHPHVDYRVALAEASGLAGRSVDLVVVAQALHWFAWPAFYAEVDRVLAPGGVVAVWTYGRPHLDDAPADAVLRTFHDETLGPYWPPERSHVVRAYRTLPFPYAELPAPAFAMEAQWTLPALLGYIGTWSAVGRYRTVRGCNPVEAFSRAFHDVWGMADTVRRVAWPLYVRVGVSHDLAETFKAP